MLCPHSILSCQTPTWLPVQIKNFWDLSIPQQPSLDPITMVSPSNTDQIKQIIQFPYKTLHTVLASHIRTSPCPSSGKRKPLPILTTQSPTMVPSQTHWSSTSSSPMVKLLNLTLERLSLSNVPLIVSPGPSPSTTSTMLLLPTQDQQEVGDSSQIPFQCKRGRFQALQL